MRFVERAEVSTGSTTEGDKRPVREIEGVDLGLCQRWSQRRTDITVRQRELARDFQKAHGRPPTTIESVALAQQANLETREAKHEPRSYADQRRTWLDEAVQVAGVQEGDRIDGRDRARPSAARTTSRSPPPGSARWPSA